MRSVKIITEPPREPISVKEAKDYARIDYSTDDPIVDNLIKAARKQIEEFTGVGLGVQKVEYTFNNDCYSNSNSLPRKPFKEIVSVTYQSCRLATVTDVTTNTDNWEVSGDDFTGEKGKYVITYRSGFEEIPPDLILAVKAQVAYQYENRGNQDATGLCKQAKELARSYKLNVWGI